MILYYENKFHYIHRQKAGFWDKEEKDLFAIALSNLSRVNVEIKKTVLAGNYDFYKLSHSNLASSYTLLIEQKLAYTIGSYGTIIAMPSIGTSFLFPIESMAIMDMIDIFYPTVIAHYNNDPNKLTLDLYWYYNGKYQIFDTIPCEDGAITLSLPKDLNEL